MMLLLHPQGGNILSSATTAAASEAAHWSAFATSASLWHFASAKVGAFKVALPCITQILPCFSVAKHIEAVDEVCHDVAVDAVGLAV